MGSITSSTALRLPMLISRPRLCRCRFVSSMFSPFKPMSTSDALKTAEHGDECLIRCVHRGLPLRVRRQSDTHKSGGAVFSVFLCLPKSVQEPQVPGEVSISQLTSIRIPEWMLSGGRRRRAGGRVDVAQTYHPLDGIASPDGLRNQTLAAVPGTSFTPFLTLFSCTR